MLLITGATGLAGSHLTYHLVKEGYAVRLLVRNKQKIAQLARTFAYYNASLDNYNSQIDYTTGDVTDIFSLEEAVKNVTHVFHCTGLVSFAPHDKKRLMAINHEGTANMVNAALAAGVKKFTYISSIAALGDVPNATVREDNQQFEPNPKSFYGNSKHYAELEVWRGKEEGLDVVIVNPTVIVGPGQWEQGSSKLFKTVWSGMPFFTKGSTGFVDVRDVAQILTKLTLGEIKNQQFILNNENLNYQQFFNSVADHLSVRRPRFEAQPWMMYVVATLVSFFSKITGQHSQMNPGTVNSAFSVTQYDNSKIQQTLNTQIEGIRKAIAFTAECFLKDYQ